MPQPPTALILAGGLGTRLAAVNPDLPKPLMPVAGQPFLHWLVLWLRAEGFADFVFSAGHKGELIKQWLDQTGIMRGASWRFHREAEPLGTGGAVRACLSLCHDPLAVINGDSLILTPLAPLFAAMNDEALSGIIIGKRVEDASRYGSLQADARGFLTGFKEKQGGRGVISAGITFLRRVALEKFPAGSMLSMENDIMPKLIAGGVRIKLHEVEDATPFLDIGTPESLNDAGTFVEKYVRPRLGA
jgi:D-glycero-alpha-D-manno-heptose 1-phosphate guanylyltransferase